MKIIFKRTFLKQYSKLEQRKQKAVDIAITTFSNNPKEPTLKNHPLKGSLAGKRAISAGFDLRIIFQVEGDYLLVEMLAVGTHNAVY